MNIIPFTMNKTIFPMENMIKERGNTRIWVKNWMFV